MTVLTLTGKKIDWRNPPPPTTKVMWSQKDAYGRKIVGSLRAIAHLDDLNEKSKKRFGKPIRIIQPMNNTTVAASAGTHDFDFCFDADIPGVAWNDVNHFFRSNGVGGWVRTPAQGFSYHWHGFTLPPREGKSISDDFKVHGFKVGKYVDGGYSTAGRLITSSQIADYYAHAFGLANRHTPGSDKSWYPKDITATIFDLPAWIARQRGEAPAPTPPKPKPQPKTPPKPKPAPIKTPSRLPDNLVSLLKAAGLTVVAVDGWQQRGRPLSTGGFAPVGVLNHHTGASAKKWSKAKRLAYAKWMFLTGRSDLPAPLCQIALGPDGTVYLGAAGRANHAGDAKASGTVAGGDGNRLYIGIEWMLSGTESIPAVMMEAGAVLNAVLTEKVTGTSVETISCHYNTSVTGKWDIGDPNGVPFNGARVLDIKKFRALVKAKRAALGRPAPKPEPKQPPKPKPEPEPEETKPMPKKPPVSGNPDEYIDLNIAHLSLQFSDGERAWKSDSEKVFSLGYDWVTGTEAGDSEDWPILLDAATRHGYKIARFRSNWVAVNKAVIKPGSWKVGSVIVADSSLVHGKGHDLNVIAVSFDHKTEGVGAVSVLCSHYPTKGRPDAKDPQYGINVKFTEMAGKEVSGMMERLGKGRALAFYGGDQNIVDRDNDTFFGGPVTSCWDELKKYPNTGHGNIDVIATFDKDGRVSCRSARAYTDKQENFYTDHFLIDATYRVVLTK